MADQHEAARVALEEVAEPGDRRHVEVVGRLVEQQHVGPLEQEPGEHRAHLPAAAELGEVAGEILGLEAEAAEDAHGLVLGEVALEVVHALVQIGHARGQVHHVLIVEDMRLARGLQLGLGVGQLLVERHPAGHAGEHEVEQRAPPGHDQLLGQVAHADTARGVQRAAVDLLLASHDAQERGLPRAIGSDEPDAIALVETQAQVFEDDPAAKEQGHVFQHHETHAPVIAGRRGRAAARAPELRSRARSPLAGRGARAIPDLPARQPRGDSRHRCRHGLQRPTGIARTRCV